MLNNDSYLKTFCSIGFKSALYISFEENIKKEESSVSITSPSLFKRDKLKASTMTTMGFGIFNILILGCSKRVR